MKRIIIEKALEQYDSNKGYVRTLVKDEPHIKELRNFYSELTEDTLSPSSLQKLALILIGKNTRTSETESGKTFENLVNKLGGYEALDTLHAANQLTGDNVAFLEKYSTEARELVPLIVSISKTPESGNIKEIFSIVEKTKTRQERITAFKELELIALTKNAWFYINTLSLLNGYDLNTSEVIFLLKGTENIIFINQILISLIEKNPSLVTLTNLINITKLKSPYRFHELFQCLPPDQHSLDGLFQANATLDQSIWFKDIFSNFRQAGWNPHPFLGLILGGQIDAYTLKAATTKLMKLQLKPDLVPLILHTMILHSKEANVLADAVEILNKEDLNENFLKYCFELPQCADKLAAALITLQKEQCYNDTTKTYISSSPEHALGLAQFWVQFSQGEYSDSSPRDVMVKQPHCAAFNAEVIEFLRQHQLHEENNIIAICNAQLTSRALLSMLKIMEKAKILDQKTIDILLPNLFFIKTLCSGMQCLAHSEQLNLFNFDTLMSDPINAVALAENLGGKSFPNNFTSLKDKGAQNFVTIRSNTKILCQGYRQGLFFPLMSTEQEHSFKQHSGKALAEAQKEILVKIAQFTGNGALETETEQNIAEEAYSSFFLI